MNRKMIKKAAVLWSLAVVPLTLPLTKARSMKLKIVPCWAFIVLTLCRYSPAATAGSGFESVLDLAQQADVALIGTVTEIGHDAAHIQVREVLKGRVDASTVKVGPLEVVGHRGRYALFAPREAVILFLKRDNLSSFSVVGQGDDNGKLSVRKNKDGSASASTAEAVKQLITLSEVQNESTIDRVMLGWATTENPLLRVQSHHYISMVICDRGRAPKYKAIFIQLATGKDERARVMGLRGLKYVKDSDIIPLLVGASRDNSVHVAEQASMALAEHDTAEATAALIALTRHQNPELRIRGAIDLRDNSLRPEVKPALVPLLYHANAMVRLIAATSFSRLLSAGKANDILPLLIEMLNDPDDEVRARAASVLAEGPDPIVVPPLLEVLQRKELSQTLEHETLGSLYRLYLNTTGSLSSEQESTIQKLVDKDITLIIAVLERGRLSPSRHAVGILEKNKSPEAVAALRRASQQHSWADVRDEAQQALARIAAEGI